MGVTEPGRDRTQERRSFDSFRSWLVRQDRLPARGRERPQRKVPVRKHPVGPNVLWLMADQLRADTFGFMGHPFIKTPNVDKLASQGTAFTRSYCSSPVCMPARATFLTGHYLPRHGVLQNGISMRDDAEVFPPAIRQAGYRTANIGKVHSGRSGKDTWEYDEAVLDAFGATKPSNVAFDPEIYPGIRFIADEVCDDSDHVLYGTYPGPVPTSKSYQLATRAMNWLYWNDDERPFFLRVSFDDPHPPVVPPEPFRSMYRAQDVPDDLVSGIAESLATKPQCIRDLVEYMHFDKIAESDHREHAAAYCGFVSHLDAQFGRILDYLEELGWADNTIVVLNADHGHMIGEHGLVHKGAQVYEGVSRIPTVVRWPGRVRPGTRIGALVDGTDWVPTILDMLGLAVPADLPGHSLVPLLEGKVSSVRDHAFVQWDDFGYCVIGPQYKLAWWDCDRDGEMYDLSVDPLEKRNLFHDPAFVSVKENLLGVLNRWRERNGCASARS